MDIGATFLQKLIVHRVGNRAREEGTSLSARASEVSEEVASIVVRNYFVGASDGGAHYQFHHESDLTLNEVRSFANQIFVDEGRFADASRAIAKHLYSKSTHPSIPGGDLFVVLFHIGDSEKANSKVLGIFKTELKESFLVVDDKSENLVLTGQTGIDPRHLQKAALIFQNDDSVLAIERGSNRTRYWLDEFLKVTPALSTKGATSFLATLAKRASADLADTSSQVAYKASISRLLSSDKAPLVSDVLGLTSDFLGEEQTARMAVQIEGELGYQVNATSTAEIKQLKRSLNPMLRSTPVGHGIDLVFSKGARPESVEIVPSSDAATIQILIKLQGP